MKKLIIVCEEKYRLYGDYLSQLISLEDDTEEQTVGTNDGEVAAQVWLEKEYLSNSAHLSSDQYLLFIGHDKLIKEKSSHMRVMFSQFGMTYGWLGKQAVLCVEKVVSADLYESFINFVRSYQSDVDTLIEKKSSIKLIPEKALVPAKAALAVIQPVAGAALAVRQLTLNKKIEAQQYTLPDEVLKEIGIKTFDYETFEPDSFEPETFAYDTFEVDTFTPDTLGITCLRRGVIGIDKVGYC